MVCLAGENRKQREKAQWKNRCKMDWGAAQERRAPKASQEAKVRRYQAMHGKVGV